MADFWQTADLVTLHNLRLQPLYAHTAALQTEFRSSKVAAVIPVRMSDFQTSTMRRIITTLASSEICEQIILVLNGASEEEYREALRDVAGHSPLVDCLWVESPAIQSLLDQVQSRFGEVPRSGKGLANWLGLGYALQNTQAQAIGFQDGDVDGYSSELFARLCTPILRPDLQFSFSKGYYARTGDRLYGRVARLLLLPALLALSKIRPDAQFPQFLLQFRYPLAGEIALRRDFAWDCPMQAGWSLELGALWQAYQFRSMHRICQVELADNYIHRHHSLEADSFPESPLQPMAREIAASLLRYLDREGAPLLKWQHRAFLNEFARCTVQVRQAFRAESIFNGLPPNDAEEESAIALFQTCLEDAMERVGRGEHKSPLLPSWNRIVDAIPGAGLLLRSQPLPLGAVA